jgi:predicted DNA-binding protein YlxM (UPF0122 family)
MLTTEKVQMMLELYEQEQWQLKPLAEKFGCSVATASRVITGQAWKRVTQGVNRSRTGRETDFRRNYIAARLDQGCTNYAQIAAELGISRQAVSSLVKTMGEGGA